MSSPSSSAFVLLQQAASLLLYQSVLASDVGQALLDLLEVIHQSDRASQPDQLRCLRAYGRWFHALAQTNQSWPAYLTTCILHAENPFTLQAQCQPLTEMPEALVQAARHDLHILQALAACDGPQLCAWVEAIAQFPVAQVTWEPSLTKLPPVPLLSAACSDRLERLAAYYHQHGTGLFAQYQALRWQDGQFVGIPCPDPVRLADLVGYEEQQATLVQNTEFLLKGLPALHVLLYGSRGSGKSSLVKALLNQYGTAGLRLIEVTKADLTALPAIADRLRDLPQKFIIFVDDLSFEEDEDAYKALKVVLEGNVTARPQNVVVYATSNRRHLIREFFGDRPAPREGDEIHAWDTVQEKLSFSDRFGLTLTFEPANQTTYLQIVHHLAQQAAISLSPDELTHRALQWATRHNGRSGRTARQFINFLQAELALQYFL